MEKINTIIWDMLTDEEKTAFSLQHGYNKSTWEAGEIIGRAHYKYLEIKQRAEKFLQLFTHQLNRYGRLIPTDIGLTPELIRFLELTIGGRKPVKEATSKMAYKWQNNSSRGTLISSEIYRLQASDSEAARDFLDFVTEFDRWNNFRILPKTLQLPSAYKRRNTNRYKQRLKQTVISHPMKVELWVESYCIKTPTPSSLYLPIIYDRYKRTGVFFVEDRPFIMSKITGLGLYLFDDPGVAAQYISHLLSYNLLEKRVCTKGQKFWPTYRDIIQQARNYREVENIRPGRVLDFCID